MHNPIDRKATVEEAQNYLEVLAKLPFSLVDSNGSLEAVTLRPFCHMDNNYDIAKLHRKGIEYSPCDDYLGLSANQIMLKDQNVPPVTIKPDIELIKSDERFIRNRHFSFGRKRAPGRYMEAVFVPKEQWEEGPITNFSIAYGVLMGIPWDVFTAWKGFAVTFALNGEEQIPYALLSYHVFLEGHRNLCGSPPRLIP